MAPAACIWPVISGRAQGSTGGTTYSSVTIVAGAQIAVQGVLPGTVVFTVDIRSPEQAKLDRMRAKIEAEAPKICEALGVKCSVEPVGHFDPVTFDPTLVARVRAAADKLGYSHMNIISGAGHDACWTNRVAPSTMIMCPCVDGLSHNEAEDISKDWASAGADVLFHAVVETAEIVE